MIRSVSKPLSILSVLMASLLPVSAMAQNGPPPGPPMAKIAKALGVSESALEGCMPRPKRGSRPERPDPKSIASCLQASVPDVTEQQVADVLKANAPSMPPRSN